MIGMWRINFDCGAYTASTVVEANTRQSALAKLKEEHRDVRKVKVVKKIGERVQSFDELAKFCEKNGVSPKDAQTAIQIMVLNTRRPSETQCPKCHRVFSVPNYVDNAYYCPHCKTLLQVG